MDFAGKLYDIIGFVCDVLETLIEGDTYA